MGLLSAFAEAEAFTRSYRPLSRAAGKAVAESLTSCTDLRASRLGDALRDALVAENADRDSQAATKCRVLRSALAAEVQQALAAIPAASDLASSWPPAPGVRVEVRGTAARRMTAAAFAVGRSAECDVQLVGDATVMPVHCLVVSLPAGIVLADFWSEGGTSVIWQRRGALAEGGPVSAPAEIAAFAVQHGERTVLRLGARTTITVGPSEQDLDRRLLKTRKLRQVVSQRGCEKLAAEKSASFESLLASTSCDSVQSASRAPSFSSSEPRSRSRSPKTRAARFEAACALGDAVGTMQDAVGTC